MEGEEHPNIKIHCEGKTWETHSKTLQHHSTPLYNLSQKGTESKEIKLEGVNQEDFSQLIRYMYGPGIDGEYPHLERLLATAKELQMGGATNSISLAIKETLTPDNINRISQTANNLKVRTLEKACVEYTLKNKMKPGKCLENMPRIAAQLANKLMKKNEELQCTNQLLQTAMEHMRHTLREDINQAIAMKTGQIDKASTQIDQYTMTTEDANTD